MSFKFENVAFCYKDANAATKGAETLVLEGLNGEIPAGECTAILGRSGVGKSTLLYLLGLQCEARLKTGEIVYQGDDGDEPLQKMTTARQEELRRHKFGFAMQSASLMPQLTCLENLALPLALQGVATRQREARAAELLSVADGMMEAIVAEKRIEQLLLGAAPEGEGVQEKTKAGTIGSLRQLASKGFRAMSGGERRRIALLRGIIHDPDVLFCDEPVSNLDQQTADVILRLLERWQSGDLPHAASKRRTLVMVTHDAVSAARLGNHFLVFHDDGRLAQDGTIKRNDNCLPKDADSLARILQAWVASPSAIPLAPAL